MLMFLASVAIGFMAAIAIVVWQWTAIVKLKGVVDDLRKAQEEHAAALFGGPTMLMGAQQTSAPSEEDRLMKAIEALGERLAPQPKPVDPIDMIGRRLSQIEQDVMALSAASQNHTNAIDHHTARLDAHSSEHTRLDKAIRGVEFDTLADLDKLRSSLEQADKRHAELASRMDRTFGQLGTAVDVLSRRVAPPKAHTKMESAQEAP